MQESKWTNSCDVSMSYTACLGDGPECEFYLNIISPGTGKCSFNKGINRCTCTAAIRAAIEEERLKRIEAREKHLQSLGFDTVSDKQRADNRLIHDLDHSK